MKWQKGIAFIRGINMYSNNRISSKEIIKLCKRVENENIKIISVVKADNIIFMKKNVHYAFVGKMIEKELSKHFKKPMFVTTRSINSLNKCIKSAEGMK